MSRNTWLAVARGTIGTLALGVVVAAVPAIPGSLCGGGRLFAQSNSSGEAHARAVAGIEALVDAGLPRGVWIPTALQPAVLRMLTRSPTFREQCAKLASYRFVHIGVAQDDQRLRERGSGALAEIRRYSSGIVTANIVLPRDEAPYELLSHEFEHILEFLEGQKLRALAVSGVRHNEVWLGTGGVETRRAVATGQQVAMEMDRPIVLTSAERSFWK